MAIFTKDIGIDLGTANSRVFLCGKGIALREPTVVAVNTHTDRAKYVGTEAKEVIGRTPGSIVAVHPLKGGVIADFDTTTIFLQELLRKAMRGALFTHTHLLVSVPMGITPVERRAVREAAMGAGAKPVQLVEAPMAAAIGAGLPTTKPVGSMIVTIGAGITEVAVISLGGVVHYESIRCAGDDFDAAIINYLKKRNILIGEGKAEDIKINIGMAAPTGPEKSDTYKGRDVTTGLLGEIFLSSTDIMEALSEPVARITDIIRRTLEQTPPELAADIIENGIILTGGSAMLSGLDRYISRETGIDVYITQYPFDCVAEGLGKILAKPNRYHDAILTEEPRL